MSRARRVGAIVVALLIASLLVIAGRAGLEYYRVYRKVFAFEKSVARTDESIRRHGKDFLEDQAYAASLPLFARRIGTRDAGPVIGPRIHWIGVKPGLIEHPALYDKAIDRGLFDKLGEDWPNAAPDLWRNLDFSWMRELAQLDFWDLEENSVSDPADLLGPRPDASDLWAWAKLRLAKGLHENALPAAVAEVEDLARLCFTSERLDVEVDGLYLLSAVRTAQKRAGSAQSRTDLGRIQRALFGALAFARLETPPEHTRTLDQLVVGRCSALHNGTWAALSSRAELHDSRSAEYRRLEDLLARFPECRLRMIRARWPLPDGVTPQGSAWWDRTLWRWSPAWRRVQGEIMVAIGAQDWFKGYDLRSPGRSPPSPPERIHASASLGRTPVVDRWPALQYKNWT
jgi:hypothetical protein